MSDPTRDYYDEFSNWYERERGHGYHAMIDDLEVSVLEPFARGGDVLEVGCGTGLILSRIQRIARSAVGIDLSAGMLARARDRGLTAVQALATELPFADGSFDAVCSFKVLAHVESIERALAEMARVTRPGGVVLAEFYNPWSLRYLAKRLAGPGRISQQTTEDAVFTRYDSTRDIARLCPSTLRLESFRGVRVVTPAASVFRVPVAGALFRRAEFLLRDTPAAHLAGFVVAILRKV